VLQEPALFALFDDPDDVRASLTQVVQEGMKRGGPERGFECFLRFAAGDANWQRLDPNAQTRMLASVDTYFGVESGAFDSYFPDDETLASIAVPIKLVVSTQSHAFFAQAATRLAALLGTDVAHTPGTHFPYLDHPQELAQTVRPFLRWVSR
jgi:pimeloyl-ACP methyl ester carboxylesterase